MKIIKGIMVVIPETAIFDEKASELRIILENGLLKFFKNYEDHMDSILFLITKSEEDEETILDRIEELKNEAED